MAPISRAHTRFLTYIYSFPDGQLWNKLCVFSSLSLSLFPYCKGNTAVVGRYSCMKYTRIEQMRFQLKSCVYWEWVHDWAPSWASFAGSAGRVGLQFCVDSNGECCCQSWSFTFMSHSHVVYFYTVTIADLRQSALSLCCGGAYWYSSQ